MTTLNVQFTSAAQTTICSYFAAPQNPSVYSNLGTVDTSDARWASFYNSMTAPATDYLPLPG